MRRLALFGASGFIGGHVLAALRSRGASVEVLCIGRTRVPEVPWARFDLATGDPGELATLLRAWRPDSVINCSGTTVGTADELAVGNVVTVRTLVRAMERGVTGASVVHLGSAAEYGPSAMHDLTTEDRVCEPTSEYGVSKLEATRVLLENAASVGIEATVLRVFNPVGAGAATGSVLGNAAVRLAESLSVGRRQIELGPLGAFRDFVDVSEVARAVGLAAGLPAHVRPGRRATPASTSHEGSPGSGTILNIGSGYGRRVRDVVRQLCEVAGYVGEVLEDDNGSSRSSRVSWQVADVSRAREVLGWSPSTDLSPALTALWEAVAGLARPRRRIA